MSVTAVMMAVLLGQGSAVAEPRPTVAQAEASLAELEDEADQMVERYNTAAERYKASKKKYDQLNAQLRTELTKVAELRENLVATAVGTYQSGDTLLWLGFADQRDPAAMLSGPAAGNRATGPGSYDCSGFTQASWAKAGVSLPRTTYTQWSWGASRRVSLDTLQPGDLLFSRGLGHMGMYVGGGKMIHAPRTGDVVKVVPLDAYWRGRLLGAVRP